MNYYVISGDLTQTIYAGKIVKDKATGHVTATIRKYFKKDDYNEWKETPLSNNLHINGRLATKFYRGQVTEYATLEIAKKTVEKRR